MKPLNFPTEGIEQSFIAFARRIHEQCPDHLCVDLSDRQASARRALCGEHGRVVPTRQNVCPKCAGYVEMIA